MNEIKCVSCGKELTGGPDTFGKSHEPQCQVCFLAGELTPEEKKQAEEDQALADRIEALKAEAEDLHYDLQDISAMLAELEPQVKALMDNKQKQKKRLDEIRAELSGWAIELGY